MAERRGYRPIADYAAIGDCHGCALVASDGAIDWACFERFDAAPHFSRLLDAEKGGYLAVSPSGEFEVARAYLPGTNMLRTVFRTSSGEAAVTDFMPLGREPGSGPNDYVRVRAPGCLVRRIECTGGTLEMRIVCRRPIESAGDLGAFSPREDGRSIRGDIPFDAAAGGLEATITLRAGERRFVAVSPEDCALDAPIVERWFETTRAYWREWIGYCRYAGPYAAQVERSALALKLMTFPHTGACVAALTTSLPEQLGGERNWDYRFCWIRDASLMLHALAGIGYAAEAHGFFGFLCDRLQSGIENLQVMYGIGGEAHLAERVLPQLDGYRGSRPVRAGNAAFSQGQIDLYGYILEGACVYESLGGRLSRDDREALAKVADFIERCWLLPDSGIWEMRGPPRHHVHSKAMCWVVLDRAIRLFGARPGWAALREEIRKAILQRGRHPDGHLLQSFGAGDGAGVDAALLQLPALGFPLDAATLRRTRLAVERELSAGEFLVRYRSPDGVPGADGAFLACSFWHVDALLAEGEAEAATRLFERLLAAANDVGLYAEEMDPGSGDFLGNFPQAFTHLALVNTAVSLDLYRRKGPAGIRGGYAERAQRSVGATVGWRGVAAAFLRTGKVRLRSSRASLLDAG
jgi:alpha,alpha-trehalase